MLKDWRGTPIEVGSRVVYPGRGSSSMWLNEGEVIEVGSRATWEGPEVPVLRVRRLRQSHYGNRDVEGTSTLTRLDMVTVVG